MGVSENEHECKGDANISLTFHCLLMYCDAENGALSELYRSMISRLQAKAPDKPNNKSKVVVAKIDIPIIYFCNVTKRSKEGGVATELSLAAIQDVATYFGGGNVASVVTKHMTTAAVEASKRFPALDILSHHFVSPIKLEIDAWLVKFVDHYKDRRGCIHVKRNFYFVSRGIGAMYATAALHYLSSADPAITAPAELGKGNNKKLVYYIDDVPSAPFFGCLDAAYTRQSEFKGVSFEIPPRFSGMRVKHFVSMNDPFPVRFKVLRAEEKPGCHGNLGGSMPKNMPFSGSLNEHWAASMLESITEYDFSSGVSLVGGNRDNLIEAINNYVGSKARVDVVARSRSTSYDGWSTLLKRGLSQEEADLLSYNPSLKSDLIVISKFEEKHQMATSLGFAGFWEHRWESLEEYGYGKGSYYDWELPDTTHPQWRDMAYIAMFAVRTGQNLGWRLPRLQFRKKVDWP